MLPVICPHFFFFPPKEEGWWLKYQSHSLVPSWVRWSSWVKDFYCPLTTMGQRVAGISDHRYVYENPFYLPNVNAKRKSGQRMNLYPLTFFSSEISGHSHLEGLEGAPSGLWSRRQCVLCLEKSRAQLWCLSPEARKLVICTCVQGFGRLLQWWWSILL